MLRAKVEKPPGLFGGGSGFEWKEDTIDCESALLLAILHARLEVLRVLLEKGARVDGEVQWRSSHVNLYDSRSWTADQWRQQRCQFTYSFPSALARAVGRGGTATECDGTTWHVPDRDGKLHVSLRGGVVTLNHLTRWQRCSAGLLVRPHVEIVRLLLAYGARVTDVELEGSRKSPDQEFLDALLSINAALFLDPVHSNSNWLPPPSQTRFRSLMSLQLL
ncbi:hypothetical protein M427DRAFT_247103 [Gonapodya prolifera JEL478]|uniref:Uncharacterized protein n=1 Tax=Gonapodya prolifera (strain JEL478) TaxID=1344416 RepID=A0A139AM58_GONPJ|nr:hypothetical protein M427DRAFT_247103 [Gonapodya prolifera JEL478]|eukprot:KXS17841.1 hypothetical protein M427DRAFT_247103 [Gonapodya prolifera JEL478]